MTQCSSCGQVFPGHARFCPACGQPLTTAEETVAEARVPRHESTASTPSSEKVVDPAQPPPSVALPSPSANRPLQNETTRPTLVVGQDLGEPIPTTPHRRTVTLLGLLSGLLALALLAGGVLAYVELDRRAARERALVQQVAQLSQANLDFQSQVTSLTGERDRLASERDSLTAERNRLLARVGELETIKAEQERRIQELTGQVEEQSRQLSQAREEATRQQERANAATEVSLILGQVVALDDEIHEEFGRLFQAVLEMQDAYYLGNRLAFESAARRADQSAQRLEQLFAQRDQLLAQLGL